VRHGGVSTKGTGNGTVVSLNQRNVSALAFVSVIEDIHNDNTIAKDDNYTIAPLLGWTWGFDIAYKDVANIGKDDLADFTVNKRPFNFIMAPSAGWKTALGAKYGAGDKQDFWNIKLGDCQDCAPVPESSTMLLMTWGLIGFAGLKRLPLRTRPRK